MPLEIIRSKQKFWQRILKTCLKSHLFTLLNIFTFFFVAFFGFVWAKITLKSKRWFSRNQSKRFIHKFIHENNNNVRVNTATIDVLNFWVVDQS